jgi:lipopolysaccharide transport system ATP-binding protein
VAAITVENLSKHYQLGLTHAGSVRNLVNGWASRLRGSVRRSSESGSADSHTENSDRVDENNQFWALRDINFTIPAGEVVGIIGKNGAGKSTLLKILSRITSPSSGRVTLRGRVASLLEVGTGFHPELTGRENVYMNGTILGMTRREIDREFDAIVAFAGIDQFIDTPVKRYSSGMTVRLGFAVAAHLNPEILIVDEVLAVGDAEFQRKCLGRMKEVSESGRTVLFVSHSMASIRSLTTRAILISHGKLLFSGATSEAVDRYLEENSQRAATSGSVAELERPFGGLPRDIEFAELLTRDGAVNEGCALQIELAVTSKRISENFLVGITVFRSDGIPVGSTFSPPLKAAPVGERAEFQLGVPTELLVPGRYHCSISITDARASGHRLFDSLSDVLPFEIAPGGIETRVWENSWGAVRFSDITLISESALQHD